MGEIEKKVQQKARKERTQKLILSSVAIAGVLPIALIAPNVLGALKKLGVLDELKTDFYPSRIKRSLKGLIKKGLVEFKNYKGKKYLAITNKGKKVLNYWELQDYQMTIPKNWDYKWRVIIFDIQEKRRRVRDQLRTTLVRIGFAKLQKSVWVYPYDCEDLLILLKADMELGKNLLYMVVDEIENDKNLLKYFGLKQTL